MFLLVSGASCAGKSSARRHALTRLGEEFEAVELSDLGPVANPPTIAWRQQQVEVAALRALDLAEHGRHLLFAGDPVPAGEVLAAPSADGIDVAVCLLDVDAETQSARLAARGDPPEHRHLHHGFADWMRHHAADPSYVPEAVTTDAWPQMRWHRWIGRAPGPEWAMTVIDTSALTEVEVGKRVAGWCQDAVAGNAPVFRAGWSSS
ncbi:hypothetical protein [Ruania zhangjianzhongii]|uniref:hypothetical protein n=1 Tax=Ruania zhangjianzhongii TaxID=2603206 RepID=UPI0011C8F210|nr:hypothetical protein [Ruania zhangjianzhongii]